MLAGVVVDTASLVELRPKIRENLAMKTDRTATKRVHRAYSRVLRYID